MRRGATAPREMALDGASKGARRARCATHMRVGNSVGVFRLTLRSQMANACRTIRVLYYGKPYGYPLIVVRCKQRENSLSPELRTGRSVTPRSLPSRLCARIRFRPNKDSRFEPRR